MNNEELDLSYQVEPVDLRRYLFLVWHWLWIVILIGLLAAGGAYYFNMRITPIYQAQSQLLVSDPPGANRGAASSDSIISSSLAARTYAEMLTDQPVLEQTISELKINISPEDLKNEISVNIISGTQILTITVEDSDPERAMNIANTLGVIFSKRIQELQGERYSVSKVSLENQIKQMELQINEISSQLEIEVARLTQERLATVTAGSRTTRYSTAQERLATEAAEIGAPVNSPEKIRLDTKLSQYNSIYSNLLTSYEQVRLAEAQNTASVVQVDPASKPTVPISPKTMRNTLLAGIIGLLLGVGGIVAFDAINDSIKDPQDLARHVRLPIIGVIPYNKIEDEGPITRLEPGSPVSESYRGLRTNLQYNSLTRPLKRIMITSATPGEGKTTVATNLAIIIAQGSRCVALVDADLRRPNIHNFLNVSNILGLTDLFLKQMDSASAVQSGGSENLDVICSGSLPPNPAELLGSQHMNQILIELESNHDLIILDTPPILSVTDAAVMVPYVDGIILVVNASKTHPSDVLHAVSSMRQLGANILGLVVNGVRVNDNRYGYYYRSHYYNYAYNNNGSGSTSKAKKNKKPKKIRSTDKEQTNNNPDSERDSDLPPESWSSL